MYACGHHVRLSDTDMYHLAMMNEARSPHFYKVVGAVHQL